jgi:demethylmenaquinone methyltransferase/2-methoxy-6-polyprenyl-1,4-benzoquinol methylase
MNDREFFNSRAEQWDDICSHPQAKIGYVMDKIAFNEGDRVLDIGSGTGITIPYIEERIGNLGHITALDIAENMIKVSKRKHEHKYTNISFEVEDLYKYKISCEDNKDKNVELFDCVVAYSCYPHFKEKDSFFHKINSLLKQGGKLAIAHIESKDAINNRHRDIEKHIKSDKLPIVEKTVELAKKRGFKSIYTEDSDEYYICICEKIR